MSCPTCSDSGEIMEHCGTEFCADCDDPNCVQLDTHPCRDCDAFWKDEPDFIVAIVEQQRCWRPDWQMQVPFFLAVAALVLSSWALVSS